MGILGMKTSIGLCFNDCAITFNEFLYTVERVS